MKKDYVSPLLSFDFQFKDIITASEIYPYSWTMDDVADDIFF